MRSASIRDVLFWDLAVTADPTDAPVRPLEELMGMIHQLYLAGETEWWSRKKDRKLYLRKMEHAPKTRRTMMLLYYADANAPDASFSNLDTNHQRDEVKQAREGRPISAHFLIGLDPVSENEARYLALLEDAPGVSRVRVQSYLNYLINKSIARNKSRFEHPDPSGMKDKHGKAITRKFRNSANLQGHMSNEFIDAITEGKLRGVSLESEHQVHTDFGESTYVTARKNEIKFSPKGSWNDDKFGIINEVLGMGKKKNYEAARIIFEQEDGSSQTCLLDTNTGNILGDGFVKRVRIADFNPLLPEASTDFNPEIREEMEKYF